MRLRPNTREPLQARVSFGLAPFRFWLSPLSAAAFVTCRKRSCRRGWRQLTYQLAFQPFHQLHRPVGDDEIGAGAF